MAPPERRALLLLLGLAVAGQGVRYLATRPGEPLGQVQFLATLSTASPLAHRDSAIRRARPLAPDETIEVNSASAAELARLPRVGLRLAKTIVAYRQEHGAFGSLESLDRVPGVGPGLLKTIAPHLEFGGAAGQRGGGTGVFLPAAPLNINSATISDLDALPGIGPGKAAAILQYRQEHGRFAAVDDLARVPGLGAGTVARLRDLVSAR
jgi:competence ComEA-like helix-hairpin-helix protein